ncbi:MAG: Y4bD/Y4pK family protein [Actinomycetota bacterium]|nr:Y4bD/Y4pK family protein [Actinomycetota bacterium]
MHPDQVRVTHRFHPLSGQTFEFVNRRKNWQSDRVYFFDDAGEVACLPAAWTDMVPEDPFVVVSAGRSPFRTADLLELAELIRELRQSPGPDDVRRITP